MATPGFELLFQNLQAIGFFEFALPILFFIAVYYGLLQKTGVISDEESVNGTAAVALSFLTTLGIYVVIPFSFFPQFFAAMSILLVLVLGIIMLMGMVGLDVSEELGDDAQTVAVVGVIVLLIIVAPPLLQGVDLGITITEQHANFVLTLATIAVIGWIVTSFGE
ncbi:MAG: hypothetical protein ABEI97_01195 [Candidatus Nanohaloarchaea archaeon]